MRIDSALGTSLQGLKQGQQRLVESSQQLTAAATAAPQENLTAPIAELQRARDQVEVSARVVQAVDQTLNNLLKAFS
ncbi:hypothetical protein BOW53_06355 [Solemya pervernicosa gill symbiont]|uniref:Flagellar basal-body/hook protein C-terminal domain-containing protein n=2 Tax=Gammaproteobacteria incertae sedis TaxID=118884 RepID=A0A1T2L6Z9_9GAMM|nr:hypothetical protein [Candidatus Reidiella endopervernicosa]OOZ40832.1 hypothetical protein BOW53_06355 [Solemya pervernicosa gill symbiont]QKQ26343.1 hypothetical protein HUE57_08655 [Candidatus Reidiella endopervernicosa]